MLECTCSRFGSVLLSLTKFAGASVGYGFTVHSSMDMESVQLVKGEHLSGGSDSQIDSDFDDLPSFRVPHPQD